MPSIIQKSVCYCTNLRRSANAVSDFYDMQLKETGITISQYYLLINLKHMNSANITHWAAAVGLDRSTMVRNIALLERSDLIEQTEGHGKTFMLSKKGTAVLEDAVPVWEAAQERMKAFLGEADAEAILRIGSKLQMLSPKII